MNIFGILSMIGGLALFLYGMDAMGAGLSKLSGGRMERLLEKLTSKRIMAVLLGSRRYCSNPVFICNDSNGSRFCKFRNHETEPGCRYHYGSKYRYDNYILALKSYRDSGKQLCITDVEAVLIFSYLSCDRCRAYHVHKKREKEGYR